MRPALLLGAVLLAAGAAQAGERTIVLQERLNRRWAGQFVTYPFQAAPGECAPGSVTLAGPRGPQPAQLCDVELHPDGRSVKAARLAFVVEELLPLATHTYVVGCGPEAAAGAGDAPLAPVADLDTGRIAMRLPLGSRVFDPPAPAAGVPGPVASWNLAGEPPCGGSALDGPGRVAAWRGRWLERGPVLARVESVYTYEDGTVLALRFQAVEGERTIRVDMEVTGERPGDGWTLDLRPATPFVDMQNVYGLGAWMRETTVAVPAAAGDAPLASLSPWAGDYWFPDSPAIVRLRRATGAGAELQLCVRDPGDWVAPQAHPSWGDFATWTNAWEAPPRIWKGWQSRRLPLLATGGGGVRLRASLLPGRRHWSMTGAADGTAVMDTFLRKEITTHCNLPLLDEVKDLVLDWPDAAPVPPAPAAADAPPKADPVLDKLAHLDLFRMNEGTRDPPIFAHCRALLAAPASPAQRRLHKAQMAYLAYMAADPRHWSFERGYCSGNPNMTVTRVCNIGQFGLLLAGHPEAPGWFAYANGWMRSWMERTVTAKGYWPESAHYTEVSLSAMRGFAAASARVAGYRVAEDPKYQAMQELYGGRLATPDGAIVPHGRGVGCRLGGARRPEWTSEHLPRFGFLLRSQAATPAENFLLYLPYRAQCADGEIWPHQVASVASWYAGGKPVAGWHPGAGTQPNWAFRPHVQVDGIASGGTLASSRVEGFALLPRADYIVARYAYAGEPGGLPWGCHCGACPKEPQPFPGRRDASAWSTQLLLLHGDAPGGGSWLVLRDTLDIDRASTWTFPAVAGALGSLVVLPAGQPADALQLRLPGAGAYYAALIPAAGPPVGRAISADGKVIRLAGPAGTDRCFLGDPAGDAGTDGDASFTGTAGAVLDRAAGLSLHLCAPGEVRWRDYALAGALPAALRVEAEALAVSLSEPWPGGELVVRAPGAWVCAGGQAAGLQVAAGEAGALRCTVPAGARGFRLVRPGRP